MYQTGFTPPTTTPLGCSAPIEEQVKALQALSDRWFDEDSRAFDPTQLQWLGRLLGAVQDAFQLPTPYVYPTPEGQARAEWPGAGWEIIVNLDLQSHEADLTAVKLNSDRVDEDHVLVGQAGGESRLGKFIVAHLQSNRG